MPITIGVKRKRQCVIMAIDKSGSMNGARMDAAKEGASMVLNELADGDLAMVKVFNDKVKDLTDGVTEIDATTKSNLCRKIQSITADGMTSLYDVTLASGLEILQKSAAVKAFGGMLEMAGAEDFSDAIPNFWVVILTDGADTSSKTSLKEACELLAKIDADLGRLNLVKILLIGVELEGAALRNMEQLARAGGSSTVYENLRDTQSIRSKFHDISLQIRSAAASSARGGGGLRALLEIDSDDEDSGWPGNIQKGSHVRVVKSTHGFAGIQVGDVGVVRARDSDGDYRVNFPKKDGWCAAPSDVVLDPDAELVRPGQRVRVKRSVTNPASGWGPVTHGMVGLALKVSYDGKVKTEFGFQSYMNFHLAELEPVLDGGGHWALPFQCGQAVRIKPGIDEPSTGWGSIRQGDIGYAAEWRDGTLGPQTELVKVNFPRQDGWKGRPAELEVHAAADRIRPGATVRVQAGVDEPVGGWGTGVTHASVGLVRSVRHDGVVIVRFPTQASWKGQLRELEVVSHVRRAFAAAAIPVVRVAPPIPAAIATAPPSAPAKAAAAPLPVVPTAVPMGPSPEQENQSRAATPAPPQQDNAQLLNAAMEELQAQLAKLNEERIRENIRKELQREMEANQKGGCCSVS